MKEPLIKANRVFKYSITFQETNEESRELSDFSDSGFIIEDETDEIGDILKLAQQTYGIYYPISFGVWESTTPEQNAKYFEKGIETYYALFIENEDGTAITEEEYDFITFLLSDGNYNKSEFTDYAVGGVVLGALALGVGGLIAYYYFNKRKKGYPTGSAWTKEHYHDNKNEDSEVEPSKRKVPARNRKYVNGGEINEEEIPTPQELLYDEVKKLNQDEYVTFCNIYGIDEKDKNKMIEFIDSLSDKDAYEIIYDLNVEDYADGGEIEVVGKGNKGAFRKREYEGMTEKEVIQWWEQRGYKLSKTKSESSLKPYTFYINKFVNGGGVGDKIYLENPYNQNGGFSKDIAKDNISEIMNHVSFRKFGNEFRKHIDRNFTQENNIERVNTGISWSELASYIVGDGDYDVEQEQYENFIKSFNTTYTKNEYKGGGGVDEVKYFYIKGRNEDAPQPLKDTYGEFYTENDLIEYLNKWKGVKNVSFNSITKVYNNGESKDVTDFYLKNTYSKGKYSNGGTTTTRPTTTPEVVPDTDTKPRKPKTPYTPKHTPLIKPKARKYDFILIKK